MDHKWKLFLPAGAIILAAAAYVGYQAHQITTASPQATVAPQIASQHATATPVAITGTPDAVADTVLKEASVNPNSAEEQDPSLVSGSDQASVSAVDSSSNISTNDL